MANAPKSIRVVENTTVAGTRHVPAMAAIAEGYGKGDRLSLVRDAANPHDGWAVEVRDGADRRIGYVSCECNEFVASAHRRRQVRGGAAHGQGADRLVDAARDGGGAQ